MGIQLTEISAIFPIQFEEDVDREILGIKDKYERKLKQELDTNMRLKVANLYSI